SLRLYSESHQSKVRTCWLAPTRKRLPEMARNTRGDGTKPFQRKNRKGWWLSVDLGKKADGTRNRPMLHASTPAAVLKKKRERLRYKDEDGGQLGRSGKMTLGQWAERWLRNRKAGIPGQYVTESAVRLHIINDPISKLPLRKFEQKETRDDIRAW